MKRMNKLSVFVLCLLLAVSCCAGALSAFAFSGLVTEENGENLFSLTNTYNCTSYDEATDTVTYDMSAKRENIQIMTRPQITVLMHGLGGSAADWSANINLDEQTLKDKKENGDNTGLFVRDKDSLIERLSASCGQANVYWAKMTSKTDFDLIDLNKQRNKAYYSDAAEYKIAKITDPSKHIILVFEAYWSEDRTTFKSSESNATTYFEFNHMLSKVVRDVTLLNDGILPKVNLVGYSRGGLINLMYALDHPDMVDSLVSIGTPYFGTTTGELALKIEPGLDLFNIELIRGSQGLKDIINEKIYSTYSKRWNSNYNELYKNINVMAIGGYSSAMFLGDCVKNDESGMFVGAVATNINRLIKGISALSALGKVSSLAYDTFIKMSAEAVDELFKKALPKELVHTILIEEFALNWQYPFLFWENDVCVPLDSALGKSSVTLHNGYTYKGFRNKVRLFNVNDGTDFSKVSRIQVPVPHNLEARDRTIIDWVLSELDTGVGIKSDYAYSFTEDGTVRLEGYRGKEPTVLIPETIAGLPVTEIGQRAFEGELEKYGITSVTIPKTVKVIGASAFANNKLLTNVTFEENSELQTISSECFSGCESLENVTLPNSLMNIQSMAFYGCNSLTSITLPKNVFNCASNAFAECSSLQSVDVQSTNNTYISIDGVLFENDGKVLVLYPFGKTDFSYTVPKKVTEIAAYAFMGNKHLRSVDLNNTSYVRQFAFFDCENLNEIKGDALTFAEAGAFEDTAWFTAKIASSSEFVELGKVLFKYQGNSEEVVLKDYEYVGALAFAENYNIKKLTVEGNALYGFDMCAFYNCKNLETIKIKDASKMIRAGAGSFAGVSENLTVYVPKTFEEDYKESEDWADCNVLPISTTVHFDSDGGTPIADGVAYYAYPLSPNPVSEKDGFQFDGWQCRVGDDIFDIETGEIWEYDLEECTFTAKWSERDYTILFYIENYKVEEMHYKIGEGLIFPVPERDGYTFGGWYESEEFTGEAVTEIAAGEVGDRDYYAKWIPNKYVLTLNYNYDGCPVPATEEIEFGSAFKLDAPERKGYIFDGWRYNGILRTNENGESVMNWNITDNVELKASWTRKKFAVKIDKDGKFLWLNEQSGFSDAHTWIPYGTKFDSWDLLLEAFEPEYKEGHKFAGFEQDGEEIFWDELPDLGENGITVDIEARYIKEKDFVLRFFITPEEAQYDYITGAFGEQITLPSYSRSGNILKYWKVADCVQNEKYAGSKFAVGNKFEYHEMPDLSFNIEEDGWELYLVAELMAKTVEVYFNSHGGTSISNTSVAFSSENFKFVVPERKGYEFKGWYFGTTGSNGTGVACTDAEGNAVCVWDRVENTNLYAKWQAIVYSIRYIPDYTIFPSSARTAYTIESATFDLPQDASITGYRFFGWYTSQSYDIKVTQVLKGSTGDKVFYAKFEKVYMIKFLNENGQIVRLAEGIKGETITMHELQKTGYIVVWTGGKKANEKYVIQNSDVTFKVESWKAKEYDLKLHYNSSNYNDIASYAKVTYDKSYQLEVPYFSEHIFCGWYYKNTQLTDDKGRGFTVWKIDENGELWAKYAPSSWTLNDSRQCLITDSGRFNQHYDYLIMDETDISRLLSVGYTKLHVELTFTAWEKDDGVQYAFIYDDTSSNATLLSEFWFSHGGDKKNTTPKEYTFTADITLHKDLEILCFRYGASGKFDDDWYNKNLKVTVTPVK